MRTFTAYALCLSLLASPSMAAPPEPSHPLLGIWRLTLPDGSCSETYRFRGDGTTLVTSAQEVSESEFTVPAKPSAKGFYRLEDRVIKDNGKHDCAGAVTKVGIKMIHFIQFNRTGSVFVMCASESLEMCIGPFRRVTGQET